MCCCLFLTRSGLKFCHRLAKAFLSLVFTPAGWFGVIIHLQINFQENPVLNSFNWSGFRLNPYFHTFFYEWHRGSCLCIQLWGNSLFCLHGDGSFPGSIAVHRAIILLPPREEKMNLMCALQKLHLRPQNRFMRGKCPIISLLFLLFCFSNIGRFTGSDRGATFEPFNLQYITGAQS